MLKNFFLFPLLGSTFAEETLSGKEVLTKIGRLSQKGIVKQENGFFYIDLNDDYIHAPQATIQGEGFDEPPYFGDGLVGAHISLTSESAPPLGTEIPFSPTHCEIVTLKEETALLEGAHHLYLVVVDIPALPQLQYPYHITIGVK
jgi:hypothetical protein